MRIRDGNVYEGIHLEAAAPHAPVLQLPDGRLMAHGGIPWNNCIEFVLNLKYFEIKREFNRRCFKIQKSCLQYVQWLKGGHGGYLPEVSRSSSAINARMYNHLWPRGVVWARHVLKLDTDSVLSDPSFRNVQAFRWIFSIVLIPSILCCQLCCGDLEPRLCLLNGHMLIALNSH